MSKRSKHQKTKAQARRTKKQRDRKSKKVAKAKRPVQSSLEINARHKKRIAAQQPVAWEGENPADVAVFDDRALAILDQNVQAHIKVVREGLDLVGKSYGERAVDCVSSIPRNSQLSQWRLLIRGLDSWLAKDFEAARVVWTRLDQDRRPARIANVLSASGYEEISLREEERAKGKTTERENWPEVIAKLDSTQRLAAKLVRRIQFDRAAIRVATVMVSQPTPVEMPEDVVIDPELINRIQEFASCFKPTEPRLVNAIQQHALQLCISQPYVDVFELAQNSLAGPIHDPNHFLLAFFYYLTTEGAEDRAKRELAQYLKQLPTNEALSKPLRNALLSQSYLNEAESQINMPLEYRLFNYDEFSGREIESNLKKSTTAYPLNRDAHRARADWFLSEADDYRNSKQEQKRAVNRTPDVMRQWANAINDAAEPRLWLVDYLFEKEQLEEAEAHVQWLDSSRQDDPRVRAIGWKWKIMMAMQRSRRKSWLPEALAMLEEASKLWPAWLPKDWMDYLQAAFHLRNEDISSYEQARKQICQRLNRQQDSLVDACMMLGAAQRMHVPAADLKSLRIPVDLAVRQIKKIAVSQLFETGSFFWDLHRMGLKYPAQRMHAGKFGKELLRRFKASPELYNRHRNDSKFHDTLLWSSEARFWSDGYQIRMPLQFMKLTKTEPFFAAALLNTKFKLRFQARIAEYKPQFELIAATEKTEPNPFYRFWFHALVEKFEKSLSNDEQRGFGSFFNPFANMFGQSGDGTGECDCPECVAKRATESAKEPNTTNTQTVEEAANQFQFDFAE